MKTNGQLRTLIHSVLDCQSHFRKPTIVNNDEYFNFGNHPQVICSKCVDRLKEAIGVPAGQKIPSPHIFRRMESGLHGPGY